MTTGTGRYEVRYRFTREELRELGQRLASVAGVRRRFKIGLHARGRDERFTKRYHGAL